MGYWSDINNSHEENIFDPAIDGAIDKLISIDAWRTCDDNEDGVVIAKVLLTSSGDICVVYIDPVARTDAYAQELIQDTIKQLRERDS